MSNERLRLQLGELINATRGLVDLLADEQIEPASGPPESWPPRWPAGTTLGERLGYQRYPEADPVAFGRARAGHHEPPMTVDAKRLDLDAALMRLRFELEAERNGRATDAHHHRIVSLELADAHKLIASLETTVTELRDQRTAATRRVAELTEQLNAIPSTLGSPDSRMIEADWNPYAAELDTDGEPPRIGDGKLVARWRPSSEGPGGEVWVQFVPGSTTHPGTGSRYTVTLPIRPPDGPPRFVPGADRTDPED
jgi:uncharacterized coiled-coil protein SlyX